MEGGLHTAFVDELRDAYDAEKQLAKALPKLAKKATNADLRAAFLSHLDETRGHAERLEQVFASINERARGKHCDGIAGIIEEGSLVMGEDFEPETMDACLIASAQRSEHYEMAAYGTLVAWAKTMGHTEAARILASILEEEKAADEKLNRLAEGGINQQAADQADNEDENSEGMPARIGRAVFGMSRKGAAGASSRGSRSNGGRKGAAATRKSASTRKSGRR
jgi:ferritin-like metal-binding protein YciE